MIEKKIALNFKNKKCLVTGGTGLIGRQVVKILCGFDAIVKIVSLDEIKIDERAKHINADLTTEKFNLPLTMRFGISQQHQLKAVNLLWAIDAVNPMDNSEYINAGLEILFLNKVYFRGGLPSLFLPDREILFSLGGGVEINLFGKQKLQLDYAYEVMQFLNDVHKFSLSLNP